MTSLFRRVLLGSLLSLGLLSILPSQTLAAGIPITLTTSPITLDLHIKPGASTTQTLQFKNSSSIPLPVNMQVQVFGAYGSSGQAAIAPPKPGDDSTSWVHFSPSSFTAQPNVWTSVKMTISLPPTASLGYYYAIIFKPTIPSSSAAHTTNIKGSNAILVLVDSSTANEARHISVTNFSVTKHIYEYLPVDFTVAIHNGGNIYIPPSGDIFISRSPAMTHTIATIPFNNSGANVLPQTNRIFTEHWSDGFPVFEPKTLDGQPVLDSKGQPEEKLVWNFSSSLSKLRFGKYYAQLALTYNDGITNRIITAEVSFWVIPWKLIICLILALIIVIVVIVFITRWYFNRRLQKILKQNNKQHTPK